MWGQPEAAGGVNPHDPPPMSRYTINIFWFQIFDEQAGVPSEERTLEKFEPGHQNNS